jgi:hypothetical protein
LHNPSFFTRVSVLGALVGALGGVAYRDVVRRMAHLEKQNEKLTGAVLGLIVGKINDSSAVASSLHTLIIGGASGD